MTTDVDAVRADLEERRAELESELAALTEAPRDPMGTVSFGKRVGEGTSQAVERLAQTSAAKALWTKLQDVVRALEKLDDGTYGTCDGCGGPIEPDRLEAIPWATRCVACARAGR
ncbi:MAG: TraR/DksA family transcriptional regulator [Actinomycetota bacterium]